MRQHLLIRLMSVWVLGFCLICLCCRQTQKAVQLDVDAPAFERLSEYAFFRGSMKDLEPNDRVLPFAPITPLFTDYAQKSRFVWMPEGATAVIDDIEVFDFPVGAVLIKNFFYDLDESDPAAGCRVMETRLLVKRAEGWDPLAYVWNDEQTEAFLEIAGDVQQISFTNAAAETIDIRYVVPNKNQCKGCHEYKKELTPIGPKTRNLNFVYDFADGPANQLAKWSEMGYLHGYDQAQSYPALVDWTDASADLSDRALAYLEINCGSCHNPDGPAHVSGLTLTTLEDNASRLGVCKGPVSAGKGSGGRAYDIVPGDPDGSITIYRMESTDPGAMMPELGRTLVHREGVALIRQWISSLEGDCAASAL